jgi:hypothetical protein
LTENTKMPSTIMPMPASAAVFPRDAAALSMLIVEGEEAQLLTAPAVSPATM